MIVLRRNHPERQRIPPLASQRHCNCSRDEEREKITSS